MTYSHRFFLYAPLLVFLALLAAVGIYWWSVSNAFFARLDAANGHEIAPGITLHFASRTKGGFPFRLESVMQNVRIDVATSYGPATWTTEHFALHALTYGPEQIIFEAAGKQTLSWYDSGHTRHSWSFVPGSMRASSIVSDGSLARFDLDIVNADSSDLRAARAQFHVRRDPNRDAIDFALQTNDAHLAPALQAGFGDTLQNLDIEGSLVPGKPLLAIFDAQSDWRGALDTWRRQSGHLDIAKLELAWGKLHASGKGALSLDASHRPQGALTLNISGYRDFLAAKMPAASNAPLAAALFADSATGKPQSLAVVLVLVDGKVMLGPFSGGIVNPIY